MIATTSNARVTKSMAALGSELRNEMSVGDRTPNYYWAGAVSVRISIRQSSLTEVTYAFQDIIYYL